METKVFYIYTLLGILFSVSQRVCSKDNHTLLFKVRILDKHVGLISNNIDYYSSSDEAIRQLKANITE